jgi:site-specific recombinase XerD
MLDHLFKAEYALRPMRDGPAGPFLDGLAADLLASGYAMGQAQRLIRGAIHVVEWGRHAGLSLSAFDEKTVDRFARHLTRCRCDRGRRDKGHVQVRAARVLLDHLRRCGITAAQTEESDGLPPLVKEFASWARVHRGLMESTIRLYVRYVSRFVEVCGEDPARYAVGPIRTFVMKEGEIGTGERGKRAAGAVRMLLRFLTVHRRCSPDLIGAVPTIRTWRLATLPRYLSEDAVEKMIATADRDTRLGRRDRAVLLLLARLGLRAGDVASLSLDDVDWMRARLRVTGKGRRETWLPLPQDVGDAMLAYLRQRRTCAGEVMFLREIAPHGVLGPHGVRSIVIKAIKHAGIQPPSKGAHILRHSFATVMLRKGAPLELISRVLRHRDVQTTAIYAKVDVNMLRELAQPWPVVEPTSC